MKTKSLGIGDVPVGVIGDEQLGIGVYAQALADFVAECDTPLTVGIQGDWGSGKTSLMNLVGAEIAPDGKPGRCATVWINTWKFAQLGNEETLFLEVLQGVVEALDGLAGEQEVRAQSERIFGWAKHALVAASRAAAQSQGIDFEKVVGAPPPHKLADELKKHAAKLVELVSARFGRVVLFIDDLDRIPPKRAVQILEALKNFLDVPSLVTVLACDYGVISRGLKERVGVSEAELGRSFFDKIIQVPFRMPTHAYRAHGYIKKLLERIDVSATDDEVDVVTDLLRSSVGLNPRALKRHVNTLLLLTNVARYSTELSGKMTEGRRPLVILALTAMEARFGAVHRYLARQLSGAGPESDDAVRALLERKELPSADQEPWVTDWCIEGDELSPKLELAAFLDAFMRLADFGGVEHVLDPGELKVLREMMHLTRVSSVSDTVESAPSRRKMWNRESVLAAAFDSGQRVGETLTRLYDAVEERGAWVDHGKGKDRGSFSAKVRTISSRSIFTVFTDGRLTLNIGWLNDSPNELAAREVVLRFVRLRLDADPSDDLLGRYPSYEFSTWAAWEGELNTVIEDVVAIQ